MKKYMLRLGIICALTLLTACGNKDKNGGNESQSSVPSEQTTAATETSASETTPTETTANQNTALTIEDYFPFRENAQYIYEGKGNEYASYTVITDYIKDDSIQLRTNNGGTELAEVLEYSDGQLTRVFSRGESYYRENFIGRTEGTSEIILKEPLEKGTEWTLADKRKRYISNVNVNIETPYGNFKALEVTTESEYDIIKEYYAVDLGLVKSIFNSDDGDMDVTSTLKDVKEDAAFKQTIRFYYPNVDKDVIYYEDRDISFKTNDITKEKLEDELKNLTQDKFNNVLTDNAHIKSLYLNKDNIVNVDFNKQFVDEMNAGAGYEAKILQCITNTLGNYYGAEKVYITVEGKPYESGHILMKKGETFKVNMDQVVNK